MICLVTHGVYLNSSERRRRRHFIQAQHSTIETTTKYFIYRRLYIIILQPSLRNNTKSWFSSNFQLYLPLFILSLVTENGSQQLLILSLVLLEIDNKSNQTHYQHFVGSLWLKENHFWFTFSLCYGYKYEHNAPKPHLMTFNLKKKINYVGNALASTYPFIGNLISKNVQLSLRTFIPQQVQELSIRGNNLIQILYKDLSLCTSKTLSTLLAK